MNYNQIQLAFEFKVQPSPIGPLYKTRSNRIFTKPKYRKDKRFTNLMHDTNILRGNTFKTQKQKKKKKFLKKKKKDKVEIINPYRDLDVKPVNGRNHVSTMTSEYREILVDKINHKTICIQTEPLLNRPILNLFVEYKNGIDQSTQIIEEDGLINFDKEVKSVLRVLMNKILEESRMEVLEELELEYMSEQKKIFQQKKMKLLNEVQRITLKEKRFEEEREFRLNEAEISKKFNFICHEKLTSRVYSKKVINCLENKVLNFFEDQDEFFERKNTLVYLDFLPDFQNQIYFNVEKIYWSKIEVNDNLLEIEKVVIDKHSKKIKEYYYNKEEKKKENLKKTEILKKKKIEEKLERKKKRIFLKNEKIKENYIEYFNKEGNIVKDNFIISNSLFLNEEKNSISILGGFIQNFYSIILSLREFNKKIIFENIINYLKNKNILILVYLNNEINFEELDTKENNNKKYTNNDIFEIINILNKEENKNIKDIDNEEKVKKENSILDTKEIKNDNSKEEVENNKNSKNNKKVFMDSLIDNILKTISISIEDEIIFKNILLEFFEEIIILQNEQNIKIIKFVQKKIKIEKLNKKKNFLILNKKEKEIIEENQDIENVLIINNIKNNEDFILHQNNFVCNFNKFILSSLEIENEEIKKLSVLLDNKNIDTIELLSKNKNYRKLNIPYNF